MFSLQSEVQRSRPTISSLACFGQMQWDLEKICIRKYEKWAELVRTCLTIFFTNIYMFYLQFVRTWAENHIEH